MTEPSTNSTNSPFQTVSTCSTVVAIRHSTVPLSDVDIPALAVVVKSEERAKDPFKGGLYRPNICCHCPTDLSARRRRRREGAMTTNTVPAPQGARNKNYFARCSDFVQPNFDPSSVRLRNSHTTTTNGRSYI